MPGSWEAGEPGSEIADKSLSKIFSLNLSPFLPMGNRECFFRAFVI
jgi:hypothetical protein